MKIFSILFCSIISMSVLNSQNPEWIIYDNVQYATCTVVEGNIIWVGTTEGLVKFNKTTQEITNFNKLNSQLPSNYIRSIAIDGSGIKWIATFAYWDDTAFTGGGLAKYDGMNWTVYNTANSDLPSNFVMSIVIDDSGYKWIGTNGGLAKFDDTTWTVYTSFNSDLPYSFVRSIAIDDSGDMWIGTFDGLAKLHDTTWTVYTTYNSDLPHNDIHSIAIDDSGNKWLGIIYDDLVQYGLGLTKFDDTSWTVYTTSNSELPSDWVNSITVDALGNKWIGSGGGLVKFDGATWTVYTMSNSGLPHNSVRSLAIDGSGNKWIGTYGGLAVYKEGGVVSVKEISNGNPPETFALSQNYPNPFNPSTNISFNLPVASFVSLKVFDVIGREVATVFSGEMSAGSYTKQWNTENLSSGMYFYRIEVTAVDKSTNHFTETKKMVLLR